MASANTLWQEEAFEFEELKGNLSGQGPVYEGKWLRPRLERWAQAVIEDFVGHVQVPRL